jgi:ketosteroid isomerase-like protein
MSPAATARAEAAEGIRAVIAACAQAQDDGRTDDLVALYSPDGAVEIPGTGTYEGAAALREAFTGWRPQRPQRHVVINTVVTGWDDDAAQATSDVVFLQRDKSGWAVQVVGRYHDTLRQQDGIWRLCRRVMSFIA